MASPHPISQPTGVPQGYRAIPVHGLQGDMPLRVCVLQRSEADPVAGHFVLLRDLPDAQVYLGCVVDVEGQVMDWLELWVQSLDSLESSFLAVRDNLSNSLLDEQWTARFQAFKALSAESCVGTGWESSHPLPICIDLKRGVPVHPSDPSTERPWRLCTDDSKLRAAGLPPYSTSLWRYLHQPESSENPRFVAVLANSPSNSATIPATEVFGPANQFPRFNPEGGLMMIRKFFPLGWEEYCDVLGGKPWKGIEHGKKAFGFDGVYAALADPGVVAQSGGYFFLGLHGRAGRFVEAFHLKLQLFTEAVRQVRTFVEKQQLPLLNLSPESFRVALGSPGRGLPYLWTSKVSLVIPSFAQALQVESSEFKYFVSAKRTGVSIYRPEGLGAVSDRTGNVRIRKVVLPGGGRVVLEGTIVSEERFVVSPHDLLWMRLPLVSGRVDIYGNVYSEEGLARGEARFRSLPQRLSDVIVSSLREAEGISFPSTTFQLIPLLSSPCDLYSMGVLAVRTFLVNEDTTLAQALDEILSLARQIAAEHDASVELGLRIRSIFEQDARWNRSLGAHRLVYPKMDSLEASSLLPLDLWFGLLANILSLFPGAGPDSVCRDFGDAPALALETAFDQPLKKFEQLLERSRSLIVIDWKFNRDINNVINAFLERV